MGEVEAISIIDELTRERDSGRVQIEQLQKKMDEIGMVYKVASEAGVKLRG